MTGEERGKFMSGWIWLALIVAGVVLEACTSQLVAIWFVFGFIGALIASLFGAELWLQILVALVIGLVSLIVTRPFVNKLSKGDTESTNVDRYIGMTGLVTEDIDPISATGRVTVLGLSWAAVTDGEIIPMGSKIQVDAVEGVKLKVHIAD